MLEGEFEVMFCMGCEYATHTPEQWEQYKEFLLSSNQSGKSGQQEFGSFVNSLLTEELLEQGIELEDLENENEMLPTFTSNPIPSENDGD
jgi:NMD protein affecting ribosome stability and mRNA decay